MKKSPEIQNLFVMLASAAVLAFVLNFLIQQTFNVSPIAYLAEQAGNALSHIGEPRIKVTK